METRRAVRLFNFPTALYDHIRERVEKGGTTNRDVIRTAVANHLDEIEQLLIQAGHAPTEGRRHPVRASIDEDQLDELYAVTERTGMDTTTLLMMCLRKDLGLCVGSPKRKRLLAATEEGKKKGK